MYKKLLGREWYIENGSREWLARTWNKRNHATYERAYVLISKRFRLRNLLPELKVRQTSEEATEGEDLHSRWFSAEWLGVSIGIHLGFHQGAVDENDGSAPNQPKAWGWHHIDTETWFEWGLKYWIFRWPFVTLIHVDTWLLDKDTQALVASDASKEDAEALGQSETHTFDYRLANGEVQRVEAACFIQMMRFRRAWTPFKVRKQWVEIWFSEEVGNRRGSWKGGTVGCSCEIKPGESIKDALSRFEKTADFCRPSRFS